MTLVPAYGRDYNSKKAVMEDFDADKDFIVFSMADRSLPTNRSNLVAMGISEVNIRYKGLTRVTVVKF